MRGESVTTQTGKIDEFGWCSRRPTIAQLGLGPWQGPLVILMWSQVWKGSWDDMWSGSLPPRRIPTEHPAWKSILVLGQWKRKRKGIFSNMEAKRTEWIWQFQLKGAFPAQEGVASWSLGAVGVPTHCHGDWNVQRKCPSPRLSTATGVQLLLIVFLSELTEALGLAWPPLNSCHC